MGTRISSAIARGYGLSFTSIKKIDKDTYGIHSEEIEKATLHMVLQDDGIMYPLMVNEAWVGTICLAFYVYMPEIGGWKMVDLVRLIQQETAFKDKLFPLPLCDVGNIDVSKLEKIEAWPRMDGRRFH